MADHTTSKSGNKLGQIILGVFVLAAIFGTGLFAYQPKNAAAPGQEQQPVTKTTTLFFSGDIMLSRNVDHKMSKANDYTLPFLKVADFIRSSDIAFANLESPFNNTGKHFIEGSLIFNADPKSIEGLKFAGFDVLSTANNHAFDQGLKGIEFTLNHLEQNGIIPVGTTRDGESASIWLNTHMVEKNDTTFGFLAYSYTAHNNGVNDYDDHIFDLNHLEWLKSHISTMKDKGADIVIVSMHAGTEYARTPNQAQIDFAHAAVEAGADLVIGSHPHWIQTIEQYKNKWIFYSLGNFVFDQMWSTETREGLAAKISVQDKAVNKIDLVPVIIDDYCCPRFANPEETTAILDKIDLTSPTLIDEN